jgi:putative flippase GtrA
MCGRYPYFIIGQYAASVYYMNMKNITALLKRPGVRYLIVGGLVYAFELAIIIIAQRAGLGSISAVAMAYALGTLVSFILQKLVTFGDKRMQHKIVGLQLLATIALVIFNLGFTLCLTWLLDAWLPTVLIRTIALGITVIWNFYLYKTRIFKGVTEVVT